MALCRVLVFTVLVALVTGSTSQAMRRPTDRKRTQIRAAMKDFCCDALVHERVFGIRVSTVDRRYARARITGDLASDPDTKGDSAAAVLRRKRGGSWRVLDLGTAGVGCHDPVTRRIRRDLRLGRLTGPC